RAALKSGVAVTNPEGGSTDSVQPGFRTAPLVIDDVETGQIRTGYVVITPDSGTSAPVPTLTYGIVHDAQVDSQAAILPSPQTTNTSLLVDVFPAIGRNVGVAIANTSDSASLISLLLRDPAGNTILPFSSFTLAAHSQTARFVTELFASAVIG